MQLTKFKQRTKKLKFKERELRFKAREARERGVLITSSTMPVFIMDQKISFTQFFITKSHFWLLKCQLASLKQSANALHAL